MGFGTQRPPPQFDLMRPDATQTIPGLGMGTQPGPQTYGFPGGNALQNLAMIANEGLTVGPSMLGADFGTPETFWDPRLMGLMAAMLAVAEPGPGGEAKVLTKSADDLAKRGSELGSAGYSWFKKPVVGEPIPLFRGMSTEADETGELYRKAVRDFYSPSPEKAEKYSQGLLDMNRLVASEGEKVIYSEGASPHVLEAMHTPRNILDLTGEADVPSWVFVELERIHPVSAQSLREAIRDGGSASHPINLKVIEKDKGFFNLAEKHGFDTVVFKDYTNVGFDYSVVPLSDVTPSVRYDTRIR